MGPRERLWEWGQGGSGGPRGEFPEGDALWQALGPVVPRGGSGEGSPGTPPSTAASPMQRPCGAMEVGGRAKGSYLVMSA